MEFNKIDKIKNYIDENINAINQDKDNIKNDIVKLKEKIKEYDLEKERLTSLKYGLDKYPKCFSFKLFKKLVEELYSEVNNSEYHIYNCDIKRYILCSMYHSSDSSVYASYLILRSDISYIYLGQSKMGNIEQEVLKNINAKLKSKLKNYEFDDEEITRHLYITNDTRYNQVVDLINKNYGKLFKSGQNYIGLGFYKLKEHVDRYCDNDINKKNINLELFPSTLYFHNDLYYPNNEEYDIALIFDSKYKILEEIKNAIILFQKKKLENNFVDFILKYKDRLITIDDYNDLKDDEINEIKKYVKKRINI